MVNLLEQDKYKNKKTFFETSKNLLGERFLKEGFYPESEILPPCFKSDISLKTKNKYYFTPTKNTHNNKYNLKNLKSSEKISISTPKGPLHEREFGIIDPKKYHDLIQHSLYKTNKTKISNILFNKKNKIYSYGFPFPQQGTKNKINLYYKRSGEFIESYIRAENYLLSESYKFKFLLTTDIKNYYPSIYTHSIARAIEGKQHCRATIKDMKFFGNIVDELLQKSNDNCTNGIVIGSLLSDFVSEILLSKIDTDISISLKKKGVKQFLGIRFKDDYKILCNSSEDAQIILSEIRDKIKLYNLHLHEEKTTISNNLPENIFRPWIEEVNNLYYNVIGNNKKENIQIDIKVFKRIYLELLNIDKKYPNRGIFEKMLFNLIYNKDGLYKTCIIIEGDQELQLLTSLLLQIKNKQLHTLPLILGILEIFIEKDTNNTIYHSLENIIKSNITMYETLWLVYFFKKQDNWWNESIKKKISHKDNQFIKSLITNRQEFFTEFKLFDNDYENQGQILNHINSFGYNNII